tara:strand:- start:1316 stop:1450 length:135 start_codon:yes stop_codon:yes gene_type:complete
MQNSLVFNKNIDIKQEEIEKPEKFNSVLKQRNSRLEKIIACKNS